MLLCTHSSPSTKCCHSWWKWHVRWHLFSLIALLSQGQVHWSPEGWDGLLRKKFSKLLMELDARHALIEISGWCCISLKKIWWIRLTHSSHWDDRGLGGRGTRIYLCHRPSSDTFQPLPADHQLFSCHDLGWRKWHVWMDLCEYCLHARLEKCRVATTPAWCSRYIRWWCMWSDHQFWEWAGGGRTACQQCCVNFQLQGQCVEGWSRTGGGNPFSWHWECSAQQDFCHVGWLCWWQHLHGLRVWVWRGGVPLGEEGGHPQRGEEGCHPHLCAGPCSQLLLKCCDKLSTANPCFVSRKFYNIEKLTNDQFGKRKTWPNLQYNTVNSS